MLSFFNLTWLNAENIKKKKNELKNEVLATWEKIQVSQVMSGKKKMSDFSTAHGFFD